ncbi:MAG: lipase maturation factor family protein [Verrucomicrobia bacterium]|nr:lipase maturation factor family protein [Verrucomicrobiota bacterium]
MTASLSPPRSWLAAAWRELRSFSGLGTDATFLWPRWIVLRAVGVVFIIIFGGIIHESDALIGPRGLTPLTGLIAQLRATPPGGVAAFLKNPTLFWFNASPWMVGVVQWTGLLAAIALVLNFWPRMALSVCWVALLSFADGWIIFSDPQVDWLILETTLLCIPYAPAGYRPGLGAHSPPRPIAFFMMRWLLFRVMFENGLSKIMYGDPRWYNLTVLDELYQSAPCPTILGYFDHQLPHWWHVGEILLTYAAEFVAPIWMLFGGRRARWFAFGCWTIFQLGIQATCNFGWLNTSAIALGVLLLDDQMLADAARLLRRPGLAARFAAAATPAVVAPIRNPLSRYGLPAALWVHWYLTIVYFVVLSCKIPENAFFETVNRPLRYLFSGFGSVNAYGLFAWLDQEHKVVEFCGSNDGGRTWRNYDLRHFPQRADRIPGFIAPLFPRFEAALQIELATRSKPTALFGLVAQRLLERSPVVTGLFENDPFPDQPPQMVRIQLYRVWFTDLATWRATGNYWRREYVGDYGPMRYLDAKGYVAEAATEFDQIYVKAYYGNPQAQSFLGYAYLSGEEGVERDPAEAANWLTKAAEQGVPGAQLNLSLLLANGDGVARDLPAAARWCQRAAEQGLADAQDRLGIMYAEGMGLPQNLQSALAWFTVAAQSGSANGDQHRLYLEARVDFAVSQAARQEAQAIQARIKTAKNLPAK